MKIQEIDLKLPEIIWEVNEKLKRIYGERFFAISGGCLSDTYMGYDFKDIDVFCDNESQVNYVEGSRIIGEIDVEKIKEEFGDEVEVFRSNFNYTISSVLRLIKIKYKGYDIELINAGVPTLTEFDISLRQFYLYKDKILASERAINDIKEKQVVVVNPKTPISTYFRMHRFAERYNFKIDDKSEKLVNWAFNNQDVKTQDALEYLRLRENRVSTELYQKMTNFIKGNVNTVETTVEKVTAYTIQSSGVIFDDEKESEVTREEIDFVDVKENAEYPFAKITEKYIKEDGSKGVESPIAIYYDELRNFKPIQFDEFIIEFEYNDIKEKIGKYLDAIQTLRLKYILSGKNSLAPFPKINKEEIEKEYNKIFEGEFVKEISYLLYDEQENVDMTYQDIMKYQGTQMLSTKFLIKLSNDFKDKFKYADFVTQNLITLEAYPLDENGEATDYCYKYLMRKLTDGRYAFTALANSEPDGSGMLAGMLMKKINEKAPHIISFGEKDVMGIEPFDYDISFYDMYFENHYNHSKNFFEIEREKLNKHLKTSI